ncbi:copper homeostasis periplasmic binding protein CopC [Caballeronia mineralivorans]|jgi:methionine-rich copper-binding protein CopC|uniref:copper homeostasis periplasmic binding protein CopC n=1 Tax=Caballeronia mineralivorans TaxID=2010198 RepID=UPI0023F397E6|nr:copper homeostasis periplasmic binding protein CopC [Caballeronia mineralivorans]MDB5789022.1 copper resistance protein CopC [Caballeronia mineralivorans]MEA3100975.1 copper resistance protein [Caballeronia mineralivorans]
MTSSLANIANMAKRGALAATLLITAQLAVAHALPKQQSPAPDSAVEAPHEVAIDFSEGLEPAFSTLVVVDAAGKQVNSAKSAVDATNKKHMSVALGDLKTGTYQVEWTAVADDGHRTQGHYPFNVK